MAPTLNFDFQNSFAFEFWFWVPEDKFSDEPTLLDIWYRYDFNIRFSLWLDPAGGFQITGFCAQDFGALNFDKNWNLLVVEVKYANPTTTITARLTSGKGTSEVVKTCSGSFTNYFLNIPRDDLVFLVGGWAEGYNVQHDYPFIGYIRHIKYYKGFGLYNANEIKNYIKAYDGVDCAGDPPCRICYSNPLTAVTQPCEGRQFGTGLYLHIDFLDNSNEEYFADTTGNGYHFWKDSDQNSQTPEPGCPLDRSGRAVEG